MKKALVAVAILLALVAGGIFWAYHSIDVIVKMAVERYGPDVLGVPVSVSDVRISAKTGEGSVKNLEIGSPKGFSAARTAKFGEIRLALDPLTLTEPVVVVREIVIDAPLITYERGKGGANVDAIQRNIEAYVAKSAGSSEPVISVGKSSAPRRFIIDRIVIRGAKVTMTNPALKGQGITFDLPEVQLVNVGKRQGGYRASEVAALVSAALIANIAKKVLTNIDLLRKGGVEGAVDALKGLFK